MFHSIDRSPRRHQHSSVEMATSTVVLVPKTPTINSQNDLRSEKPEVMHFDLAPSKGEAGPSNYILPSGTSHFLPTTVEKILVMPPPSFEATPEAALPDTPADSRKGSGPSSSSASLKGIEKSAAPAPATDIDMKKQAEKNQEKEEAQKWIQNYKLKQRDEKLLKTTDLEYIEIMRVFREQQEFEAHARRAEQAAGVTAEETITGGEGKGKWTLQRLAFWRQFSWA
jgi:hypothetical protein